MSNVPSTEPPDAALLRQVADGDRRALEIVPYPMRCSQLHDPMLEEKA